MSEPLLTWTKQPARTVLEDGRHRKRWRTRCRRYAIDKYLDFGGGPYLAVLFFVDGSGSELLERNRTLEAAKRTCEDHSRRVSNGE